MTRQRLRISDVMKKSAEENEAQSGAKAVMEAIVNEITRAGIPFSKLTVISPTMTSLRLKCEMPDDYNGIKKTIVAVHFDCRTVNVRRDIDPADHFAFPFNPVDIKGRSPREAAMLVVDEICRFHELPLPRRQAVPGLVPTRN